MKRLWGNLLIALLLASLATSYTIAETNDEIDLVIDAEETAIDSELGNLDIPEEVELSLDEPEITEIGDILLDAFPDSLEPMVVSANGTVANDGNSEEFEITNGILTKYNGHGGDVIIPDGVSCIGFCAFSECDSLTSITMPDSVISIDQSAFYSCTSLKTVNFSKSLRSIGSMAFIYCDNLTNVVIPSSVVAIGDSAFEDCHRLISVVIKNGVDNIGFMAFSGCSSLKEISIPESVLFIDNYAFRWCQTLTTIRIPENVWYLGYEAFLSCYGLTDVTIDSDEIQIDDTAFDNCPRSIIFHTHCNTAASKWARKQGFSVDATDHTPVIDPAVAPTYTATGLTEGSHCADCGAVLVAQKTVDKLDCTFHMRKSASKKVNVGVPIQIVVDGQTIKSCKSSDKKVAKVSKSGRVTTLKAGKATITITLKNGKKLTLKLTVVDPYAPKSIKIEQGSKATLKVGEKLALTVKLKPVDAKTKLTWKSSDKKVAKVNRAGEVVAKKKGTATITVTTGNDKKATIKITVKP